MSFGVEAVVYYLSLKAGKKATAVNLPKTNDGVCEISFDIESPSKDKVTVTLSNPVGEKAVIVYDPVANTISFDRTQAGISDFSRDFPAVTTAPTFTDHATTSVRLFIDRSSIEMFERDGRYAMTNLVFPSDPYTTLSFSSEGKAKISDLYIYSVK